MEGSDGGDDEEKLKRGADAHRPITVTLNKALCWGRTNRAGERGRVRKPWGATPKKPARQLQLPKENSGEEMRKSQAKKLQK